MVERFFNFEQNLFINNVKILINEFFFKDAEKKHFIRITKKKLSNLSEFPKLTSY